MPNSPRSNKETQLQFSSDPASLERSIRKGRRSSSIDNNKSLSLNSRQPPSTHTLVSSTDTRSPPSTDTRSPPSTEDTFLSTDIFYPTSINSPVRTSPQDMVWIYVIFFFCLKYYVILSQCFNVLYTRHHFIRN